VLRVAVTKHLRDITVQVDLALGAGVTALVGPSGAGKTSLLRMVAGLLPPDAGTIRLDGVVLDDAELRYHLTPGQRDISLVFQEYALFPHLSVAENVAYGLRARHVSGAERRGRVGAMLERLGIGTLAGERPGRLSGGQRQRVALARALVLEPRALLLDEPLAALDVQTRAAVRHELRTILASLAIPTVWVTHDYADALAFRERIVMMAAGRVVQDGSHDTLLTHPRSRVNFFEGLLEEHDPDRVGRVRLADGVDIYAVPDTVPPGPVGVALRPWEVILSVERPTGSARNVLVGRVGEVLPLGGRVRIVLAVDPILTTRTDHPRTDTADAHGQGATTSPASRTALPLVVEITPEALAGLALQEGQLVYASFKATAVTLGPR
jgi:molybdate transport system ATP-binding protein